RWLFFFSSRRRHTRSTRDWSSDVCSSDLPASIEKPTRSSPQWENPGSPGAQRNGQPNSGFRRTETPALRPERLTTPQQHTPRRRSEERRVGKESRCRQSIDPSQKEQSREK